MVDVVTSKIGDLFSWVGRGIATGIASSVIELTPVFTVICMIGIFITMSGNKKLGTKISSLSFIVYILLKVIF